MERWTGCLEDLKIVLSNQLIYHKICWLNSY